MTLIVVLSLIGLTAVLAELVLPGGVLGILGVLCLVAAVVLTFVQFGAGPGVVFAFVLLVLGFAAIAWWMKYFHRLPVLKRLILNESSGKLETPTPERPEPAPGGTGRTLTDLMPSGRAIFDSRKLDVVSEGPFIAKGSTVEIVARRGPSVVVRAVEPATSPDPAPESEPPAQDKEAPL